LERKFSFTWRLSVNFFVSIYVCMLATLRKSCYQIASLEKDELNKFQIWIRIQKMEKLINQSINWWMKF